jgi:hypothetical protein
MGRVDGLGEVAGAPEWGRSYLWKQLSSSGVMALCWKTVMHLSVQWLISALLKEVIMPSIPLVVINDYKITSNYQQLTHHSPCGISTLCGEGPQGSKANAALQFDPFSSYFCKENHGFYICYHPASILSLYQPSQIIPKYHFFLLFIEVWREMSLVSNKFY